MTLVLLILMMSDSAFSRPWVVSAPTPTNWRSGPVGGPGGAVGSARAELTVRLSVARHAPTIRSNLLLRIVGILWHRRDARTVVRTRASVTGEAGACQPRRN